MIDLDQLSAADRAAYLAAKAKPHKYGAKATTYKGVRYDSQAEARYAADLDLQKQAGDIAFWLRQVKIPLGVDISTRIDFLVFTSSHNPRSSWFNVYAAEVKGVETADFRRVRKLWTKYGPCNLCIVKRGEVEVIEPARQP